jgi:protein gp37
VAEETKIQWTHHTWNPWRGCTKISAGCANCYADAQSKRNPKTLGMWGPNGTRVVGTESYWREPIAWNREAEAAGERRRVFCASLADVFEAWDGPMTATNGHPLWWCHGSLSNSPIPSTGLPDGCRLATMDDMRQRVFDTIAETPHLDWLLLTKRPAVMREWLRGPVMGCEETGNVHWKTWPWSNVWLGTTVENQEAAKERIPVLLDIPAAVHFLSCEPLLGPVDVSDYLYTYPTRHKGAPWPYGPVNWVIVGGESGHGARPFDLDWARSLVGQCKDANKACFVKQLGENVAEFNGLQNVRFREKGGNLDDIPADLRVREFPQFKA